MTVLKKNFRNYSYASTEQFKRGKEKRKGEERGKQARGEAGN